jgi:phenylpyruvate tautomerase
MPTLTLTTNVAPQDEKSFIQNLSSFAAKALSKPEQYIVINLVNNPLLYFNRSFEPAYTLHIVSLGNLSPELNEGYSKLFSEYLTKELGLKDDRGYIVFEDPGMAYMGYKGTTFETILRK